MITLDKLTKIFDTPNGSITAADHISMEVPTGEICVLLGPSGCGKTTTLKMVNRIIPATSGRVLIHGEDTSQMNTVDLRRNIGYVIQQIGLFPNMTIEDNISVVPKLLGWSAEKYKKRALELLDLVALDPAIFLKRYPSELSGGQQQRVGVIRALAADPKVMLMDEPFGAIDPINREVIQDEFLKMQKELQKTILFVSHDIDEAVKMGDKIAIFREGKLEQYAAPDDLLAHPANDFIAGFVGNDRTLKRLQLVTAGEVMQQNPSMVTLDQPLDEALQLMESRDLEAVTVVNREQKPIGMVRREIAQVHRGSCRDHHDGLPTVIYQDDDLRSVVSRLYRVDASWLPVVDGEGYLQGVITQRGITHHVGATYRTQA
ncbi:ABC transporter ATP-binding protein [Sansalvadorimonas sp. 2012CJ34-2]|uniref:Quaternary amine transport ATP-binding protein n=1 Tax=Parendozoicomonas callyspongiae TaxID=2942213 RepID=A0ABT0PK02_9GAMM|nr:ABC transporter ATP-binding protein [Sansalvadorimonas sp. 2012CJ34-2]MCL6270793.1 ABC transporter ATP-binding protein [Sansalvadorimonas sp. 2012CJ34-2]